MKSIQQFISIVLTKIRLASSMVLPSMYEAGYGLLARAAALAVIVAVSIAQTIHEFFTT